MKKKLLLFCFLDIIVFANAQNIGIGTIAPQTKLHIVSPTDEVLRLDANYPFVSLYTGGVYKGYLWKSSNSIEVGSATGSNLAITLAPNGNQLFYLGTNGNIGIGTVNPVQRLQVEGATYLNGNVGISNSNPVFPLTFNGTTGDKISLWNDGTSAHYGFGIQGGLFQVFSKTNIDDIAFGYGSSNSFTERMRIKGNGNVGIGTVDPNYLLDVNNRIRIRSGGDLVNTAGIWLNKTDNSALQSFIGIENDNYVGFYGLGTGWKFSMNTQTGALKINGTEGQPKQLLSSNGTSAAAFTTLGNILTGYQKSWTGSSVGATSIGTEYYLEGISHSITLTHRSRLIISANVTYQSFICVGCEDAEGDLKLKINGITATQQSYSVIPNSNNGISIPSFMVDLDPGTHSISFYSFYWAGPQHYIYPKYSSIMVLPID